MPIFKWKNKKKGLINAINNCIDYCVWDFVLF